MKPTAQRRRDRRALLDNLLTRALRGRLTVTEAALLAEQVREEQRVCDETRARLADADRNLARHREAADTAIRELEERAEQAERQRDNERERADWNARVAAEQQARAEQAEERLARLRDMADNWERRLPATIRTATAADAVRLATAGDYRPVMFAVTAATDDGQAAAEDGYGDPVHWTVYNEMHCRALAAEHRAEQAEADRDRLARAVADMHDGINQVAREAFAQRRAHREELRAAEQRAGTYRAAWHSARDRARKHAAEEKRVRGWLEHWADRARAAEHCAGRYRLAWRSARRRARAAEAALAADLPDTLAGRAARLAAAQPTAAEFADRLRQWATAGVSVAQLTERMPKPIVCRDPYHRHQIIPPGPHCQ
ncbi:hypothetical protein [Streptomyces sp. NPDC003299]